MQVSYRWLADYVKWAETPEAAAERLTLQGLAVEGIDRPWQQVEDVVVARVAAVQALAGSDHLKLCSVEDGQAIYTVVTGAPNVRVGMLAPFVRPGGRLADGRRIGRANFHGVTSEGMLCSAPELGLPGDGGGLLALDPEAWRLGEDLPAALEMDDAVLVLELTPNYAAHCLSHLGVAREVAAWTNGCVTLPETPLQEAAVTTEEAVAVRILQPEACPRYLARVVRNIRIGPSPLWLQRRLQAAGMRPVNNVVDVTNYVMLETGQPLHAFDFDKLAARAGGRREIVVRLAEEGERIVTLDGQERLLTATDLLITDGGETPIALAGVMGGLDTEVDDGTRSILLEAAHFQGKRIGKTARRLNLWSEASLRFEKGVDPSQVAWVADRAVSLIQQLCGGEVLAGSVDAYPLPRDPLRLTLRLSEVARILGVDIPVAETANILRRLGFGVEEGSAALSVEVPTRRPDVTEEIDLIEEVGRIYGLNRIPAVLPQGAPGEGADLVRQGQLGLLHQLSRAAGFSEAITYSFASPHTAARLGLRQVRPSLAIANPLREEHSHLRTLLFPGLLEALALNQRHKRADVALFELACVYWPQPARELPEEPLIWALAAVGRLQEVNWQQPAAVADVFALKGLVEAAVDRLRIAPDQVVYEAPCDPADWPFLHPGRALLVRLGGLTIGWLGELHPRVTAAYGLRGRPVVAEIQVEPLLAAAQAVARYRPIPRHPAVERDLAVLVPREVPADRVLAALRDSLTETGLLESVRLFDVYEGEGIPAGMRSLAFAITYRGAEQTLTDAAVDAAQRLAQRALSEKVGAELRS